MSRYIDADLALELKYKDMNWVYDLTDLEEFLAGVPTADAVEVVRCKDCVFCRYVSSADIYKCDRRGYCTEEVKITDYCSRGERRSENEG